MQCSCGEETKLASHEVKTLSKAIEWFSGIKEDQLPIVVEQDRCPACGRARRTIHFDGVIIHAAG